MGLSLAQLRSLAIVPHFAGALSFMGSLFIIVDVVTDRKKLERTYSRILLGMSCCDIVTSFWYGLSTWPIPKESQAVYAAGTQGSCIAQGFFIQFGLSTPLYNACLAFYYYFIIVLQWNDHRVKRAERFLHAFPLVVASTFALAGLPLTLYNNATLWCWIASVPLSCATSGRNTSDEECIRGNNAWIYRWAFFYAPLWFIIVVVTIVMGLVTRHVYKEEAASKKFSAFRSSLTEATKRVSETIIGRLRQCCFCRKVGDDNDDDDNAVDDNNNSSDHQKKAKKKPHEHHSLANQVCWQSVYYLLAFYLTWAFATCLRFLQTIGVKVPFPILLLMSLMTPLQGFLNFMVYLRPRIIKYHKKHPELTWWMVLQKAIARTTGGIKKALTSSNFLGYGHDQDADVLDPAFTLSRTSGYHCNEHAHYCDTNNNNLDEEHIMMENDDLALSNYRQVLKTYLPLLQNLE